MYIRKKKNMNDILMNSSFYNRDFSFYQGKQLASNAYNGNAIEMNPGIEYITHAT